ncbi:cystinosin homolog [Limulus polyphemus]|uniref:Cystinosin homolog n=1 Tax=Limulus polyphemus TaxID=6850 RepID=A0ABM1TH76_LIMPO|nr:cystinosin homolog [Limulus polyphemus]
MKILHKPTLNQERCETERADFKRHCSISRLIFGTFNPGIFTVAFGLAFSLCVSLVTAQKLQVSTKDLFFNYKDTAYFSVYLNRPVSDDITLSFTYENGDILNCLPNNLTILANSNSTLNYNVTAKEAGHTTIRADANPNYTDVSDAFVRVKVYKDKSLLILSSVFGWLYFIAWTVSFYPQLLLNWKRKSVVGLSFDYVALNMVGYIYYSVFNICLKHIHAVRTEYFELFPTGVIPVDLNDIFFACHAVFATFVNMVQCFMYEKNNQKVSLVVTVFLILSFIGAAIFLVIVLLGFVKSYPWLFLLYYLSYVYLVISMINYVPQLFFQCKRRSTVGWSIEATFLDISGGILSILQMVINAYNFDDWIAIFGNFIKFGSGLVSVLCDILLFIQHYYMFSNHYKKIELNIQSDGID